MQPFLAGSSADWSRLSYPDWRTGLAGADMLAARKRIDTLLPKGWPSRVRSAVVHAISMSNVVFAVTRSHAENHFNAPRAHTGRKRPAPA